MDYFLKVKAGRYLSDVLGLKIWCASGGVSNVLHYSTNQYDEGVPRQFFNPDGSVKEGFFIANKTPGKSKVVWAGTLDTGEAVAVEIEEYFAYSQW